jgi:hypothetical protein
MQFLLKCIKEPRKKIEIVKIIELPMRMRYLPRKKLFCFIKIKKAAIIT